MRREEVAPVPPPIRWRRLRPWSRHHTGGMVFAGSPDEITERLVRYAEGQCRIPEG